MAECLPGALDMNGLPAVRVRLTVPPLSLIVETLLPELSENFETVCVEIVPCPDLTQTPFNLAAEGLSGDETVIDVGSPSYLLPLVDRNKLYDMGDLKRITGSDPLFAVGAGAGPWPHVGVNCELIGNVRFSCDNVVTNRSHVYRVDRQASEDQAHENLPRTETRFALLANFYTCNGFGGEVLRIVCETRKGPLDFVTSVRQALAKRFGTDPIGLGGAILIENGKVNVHVMRDFSETPICTEPELNKWLKFYEAATPLVGLGYLVSSDPDLDLRPQHFHLFSQHGMGGHYHYDTEPATIKYTAYFNVAKTLIRVDQPDVAISFGKD